FLVNPANPASTEPVLRASQLAAHNFGLELHVLNASTEGDFDAIFANVIQLRASGLVIGSDAFFTSRSEQLAEGRGFFAAGGLVSYGGSLADSYRLAGVYAGRVLKGEKPGELPVQQGTK